MFRNVVWDLRFLNLAKQIGSWSKDPSTKAGAIITHSNRIISVGYNGLPQRILDREDYYTDRKTKLSTIIHAEENAMAFATCDITYHSLYTYPFLPCSKCASMVIQRGIQFCVAPELEGDLKKRWSKSIKLTKELFKDAGINVKTYTLSEIEGFKEPKVEYD